MTTVRRGVSRRFAAGIAGILVASAACAGIIQYSYDEAGRLVMEDYGAGKRIAYTYDANGNLLERTTTVAANPPPPPPPPPPPSRERRGGGALDLVTLLAFFGIAIGAAARRASEISAASRRR